MIVAEREAEFAVVRLPDRFGAQSAKELLTFVGTDGYKRYPDLVLDFSVTDFIDSTAIGILVTLSKEYKGHAGQFLLRNLNEHIAELFADTGLEMLFTIVTSDVVRKATIDLFAESVDIRLDINIERAGEVCIFHLGGVMNHPMGSRYFKQQFLLALASSRKMLLDFEALTFFDSLSISVVLSMNKLLRETGGSLRFCSANYIVADLFATLNINQIIPVYDTVAGALADWP